jgi:RNA polymerase sigma factor (sigma-70 family)
MPPNGPGDPTGPGTGSSNGALQTSELLALFAEIRPQLLQMLRRRMGSADAAADLTQDLFIKLNSIRAILPDREQARAYIFRMAANLAIDRNRVESRRAEILNGIDVLFENADPDPEVLAVTRDQMRHVEKALSELPDKCREVLVLSRLHELSHREIAERLHVSISLVEKYQLRALRHCRDRLAREF